VIAMTRVRIFTVFLMAILAGGGLAYGTYDYLQNVPVKTVTTPTRKVVVANADLSLGRQLRRVDLSTLDWPAKGVPEGSFEDPAAIVDRGLIVSVVKNEPILPAKLASKEALDELEKALDNARAAKRTSVIVIETDPAQATAAGGAWWDVPVAEVSASDSVRRASAEYRKLRST
jgi:Flp pilus assembly protein CpaB